MDAAANWLLKAEGATAEQEGEEVPSLISTSNKGLNGNEVLSILKINSPRSNAFNTLVFWVSFFCSVTSCGRSHLESG